MVKIKESDIMEEEWRQAKERMEGNRKGFSERGYLARKFMPLLLANLALVANTHTHTRDKSALQIDFYSQVEIDSQTAFLLPLRIIVDLNIC